MTVKLNLRSGRKNNAANDSSPEKHAVCLLGALFAAVSVIFFIYGGIKLYLLRSECAEITSELNRGNDNLASLDREYSTIKERNADIESRYDFVLSGIPAMEFLSELVDAVPDGVIIETVSMNSLRCSLSGIAFDDEEILEFTEKLGTEPAVAHIALPVITTENINGAVLKRYSVEITTKSLAEVLSDPVKNSDDDAEEGKTE
ncbi:MAG: PilN domain-containing protein [Synergistes sp.]|nr:PilN domain-containing protein [Synergistes sp.]